MASTHHWVSVQTWRSRGKLGFVQKLRGRAAPAHQEESDIQSLCDADPQVESESAEKEGVCQHTEPVDLSLYLVLFGFPAPPRQFIPLVLQAVVQDLQ